MDPSLLFFCLPSPPVVFGCIRMGYFSVFMVMGEDWLLFCFRPYCKEYICVEVATIPSIVGAYDMLLR